MARQPLGGLGRLIFRGFTITLFGHTTLGRAPLDEGPARRRDLYLTTHNTHKRQTSMPPVRFEPTILVSERPQTHALDRTATGIGNNIVVYLKEIQWGGTDWINLAQNRASRGYGNEALGSVTCADFSTCWGINGFSRRALLNVVS
jgi:hypothetical protein